MELLSEFVMYAIKYVVLILVAFAGIMAGIYYKKNKIAKNQTAVGQTDSQMTE